MLSPRERLWRLGLARELCDLQVARQYTPYKDGLQAAVLPEYTGLLHMYLLANSEEAHAQALLERFNPPEGALIADVGCGTGRLTRLLQQERIDLTFILLDGNLWHLRACPTDTGRVAADGQWLPLRAESVDVVLVSYALGYFLAAQLFFEAKQVLTVGGQLVVYDLVAKDEAADLFLVTLGYKTYTMERLRQLAAGYGFKEQHIEVVASPVLSPLVADVPGVNVVLQEVEPVCCVWNKG